MQTSSLKKLGLLFIILISFSRVTFAGGWWYEASGQADADFQFEMQRGTDYAMRYGKPFYPGNVNMSTENKNQIYNHTLAIVQREQRRNSGPQGERGLCAELLKRLFSRL